MGSITYIYSYVRYQSKVHINVAANLTYIFIFLHLQIVASHYHRTSSLLDIEQMMKADNIVSFGIFCLKSIPLEDPNLSVLTLDIAWLFSVSLAILYTLQGTTNC